MAEGRIPQSFIDDVLLRTDIVDVIDARVKLKRAGKNYSACCPFHQEKTPSFTVNREKQFYYCFGCGASGNALSFLLEHDRLDFIDGLKQLASNVGLSLPETRSSNVPAAPSQQPLYDALEKAAHFYEQQLRTHKQRNSAVTYLKKRGLTGKLAQHFRIGYAPPGWDNLLQTLGLEADQKQLLLQAGLLIHHEERNSFYDALRDRVIFPIRDFRGRVIAFGGRVLGDDKPKYLNSPESTVFHKGRELYGLYEAKQSGKLSRLIVVEGYMDVVALAQHGIHEAVATLGTATSTAHVERMLRVVNDIIFCFDGDDAGRRAAWRALENALPMVGDDVNLRFLFLPEGEDPDSLVRREGADLFRARMQADAITLTELLFTHLSEDLDLSTLEGRSRLASTSLPLIAQMPDSLFRSLVIQSLSERTQLSQDLINSQLVIAASKPKPPTEPQPAPNQASRNETERKSFQRVPSQRPERPRLRTLSAQVIALILRQPELVARWREDMYRGLADEFTPLLLRLRDDISANPQLSLAAILGRWHGTEQGDALATIAATDLLPSHEQPELEVVDIEHQLNLRALQAELDILTEQLRQTPDHQTLQAISACQRKIHTLQQTRRRPTS
ncbi:MAG: DNA primase [Moraxellaceae bacterium]|nr:DNA primase [Moraxellaceae bacterium]MDZ4386711.1 DNA primase [Moraxellaceae bacterium]